MRLILIIKKNIKKLLCIGIAIDIMSYIYCMPIDTEELLSYLIKNIVLSLIFLLMIHGARLNNFTGATRVFSKIPYAKYSEFFVVLLTLLAAILGLIVMVKTKEFENSCLLIPSFAGLYSASKATCIYENELKKKD